MKNNNVYYGTGKRKTSIAKVKLTPGKGKITINGLDIKEYLPYKTLMIDLMQPLVLTKSEDTFDIEVNVTGGGFSGQTGAIRHGITKALLEYDINTPIDSENSFRKILKGKGFITRDSRKKERKKPGLKKARKAPQFSKR